MNRFFILFCLFVMGSAFVSVIDATKPREVKSVDDVRAERVAPSVEDFRFWRFDNYSANKVEEIYAIGGYPAVSFTPQAGEQQAASACGEEQESGVSVWRL